jgi:hypothetical protein
METVKKQIKQPSSWVDPSEYQVNINVNANKQMYADLESLDDDTMNTFHLTVERALLNSVVWRTNNNVPLESGQIYYTCPDEIPDLINQLKEWPDMFKDLNIVTIKVLSNDENMRRIRKFMHVDEMSLDYMHDNIVPIDVFVDILNDMQMIYKDEKTGEYVTAKQKEKIIAKEIGSL